MNTVDSNHKYTKLEPNTSQLGMGLTVFILLIEVKSWRFGHAGESVGMPIKRCADDVIIKNKQWV